MSIATGERGRAADFVDTASGAADAGKVAKLNADGLIPIGFLESPYASIPSISSLNGDLLAVSAQEGSVHKAFADAATTALGNKFFGFTVDDLADHKVQAYLDQLSYNTKANTSFTVRAGTKRYLLIYFRIDTDNSGDNVTAITWNGIALSLLTSADVIIGGAGSSTIKFFGAVLGDSVSDVTANIVHTYGTGGGTVSASAMVIENIDQLTPVVVSGGAGGNRSNIGDYPKYTLTGGAGFALSAQNAWGTITSYGVELGGYGSSGLLCGAHHGGSQSYGYSQIDTGNGSYGSITTILRPAVGDDTVRVQTSGVVSGFTGLKAGSIYYLATPTLNTPATLGQITNIKPVSNAVVVGRALSTTTLLIIPYTQV